MGGQVTERMMQSARTQSNLRCAASSGFLLETGGNSSGHRNSYQVWSARSRWGKSTALRVRDRRTHALHGVQLRRRDSPCHRRGPPYTRICLNIIYFSRYVRLVVFKHCHGYGSYIKSYPGPTMNYRDAKRIRGLFDCCGCLSLEWRNCGAGILLVN
jgi:hypothetical protein